MPIAAGKTGPEHPSGTGSGAKMFRADRSETIRTKPDAEHPARPPVDARVSVIVVNYNGGELVPAAVEAVLGSSIPVEVIVSDNGSRDGSLGILRERYAEDTRVRLVENRTNLGFAKAVNIGMAQANGEFVLLLNPDCIVDAGALPALLNAMDAHPGAGMVGGLVRNPDGSEQVGCRRRIPTPWRSTVRALRLDRVFPDNPRFEAPSLTREPVPEAPVAVEAISGALMLIRRTVLADVGPLDERYFLHVEDLDLCLRVRRAGSDILFVPQAEAVHHKSFCSRDRQLFVLWHKHLGMMRFYWRFFHEEQGTFVVALATVGLWVHFAASAVSTGASRLRNAVMGVRQRRHGGGAPSRAEPGPRTDDLDPGLESVGKSPGGSQSALSDAASARERVVAGAELADRNVLVTGASGFVGRHLAAALQECHANVAVLLRRPETWRQGGVWRELAGDLTRPESLQGKCGGIDTVFHLAGLAHVEGERSAQAGDPHWRITVEGTRALLAEAVRAGVRRFVFVSTVKAMGEGGDKRLDEASAEAPESAYGRAKLAAERLVSETCDEHGIEWVVLRLPMVYGRDNKGNLPRMVAAVDKGWFPALPEVRNRRSMVHVDDVVQALLLVAAAPEAAGEVYIVTDGQVYSTREILDLIRDALGLPALQWSVPWGLLKLMARLGDIGGRLLRRRMPFDSAVSEKLLGSAWYSSEKIARELGYRPTRMLRDVLPEIVAEYRSRNVSAATPAPVVSVHQTQTGRQ